MEKNDLSFFPVPMSDIDRRDVYCMAATIYGEARGESFDGCVAVGWVIKNRALNPRWWGDGIIDVCQKTKQFSCWNPDDPNFKKCYNLLNHYHDNDYLRDPVFRKCFTAALNVLDNILPDPVNRSDHYHKAGIVPSWADKSKLTGTIGNHIFYKLEL